MSVAAASSEHEIRPRCINYNCTKPVVWSGQRWRPWCDPCFQAGRGKRAYPEGVTPFRKGCCSNKDGHLGFNCYVDWARVAAAGARIKTVLDHKDGNHLNNTAANVQELCEPCHSEKSRRHDDYRPNRYARKHRKPPGTYCMPIHTVSQGTI